MNELTESINKIKSICRGYYRIGDNSVNHEFRSHNPENSFNGVDHLRQFNIVEKFNRDYSWEVTNLIDLDVIYKPHFNYLVAAERLLLECIDHNYIGLDFDDVYLCLVFIKSIVPCLIGFDQIFYCQNAIEIYQNANNFNIIGINPTIMYNGAIRDMKEYMYYSMVVKQDLIWEMSLIEHHYSRYCLSSSFKMVYASQIKQYCMIVSNFLDPHYSIIGDIPFDLTRFNNQISNNPLLDFESIRDFSFKVLTNTNTLQLLHDSLENYLKMNIDAIARTKQICNHYGNISKEINILTSRY